MHGLIYATTQVKSHQKLRYLNSIITVKSPTHKVHTSPYTAPHTDYSVHTHPKHHRSSPKYHGPRNYQTHLSVRWPAARSLVSGGILHGSEAARHLGYLLRRRLLGIRLRLSGLVARLYPGVAGSLFVGLCSLVCMFQVLGLGWRSHVLYCMDLCWLGLLLQR